MARDKVGKQIKSLISGIRVVRAVCEDDYSSFHFSVPYYDRMGRQKSEESWRDDIATLKKILADYQAAIEEDKKSLEESSEESSEDSSEES